MKSQSTMYIQRGRLTHVYASLKLIIDSDDGLSLIEANANNWLVVNWPLKAMFSEIIIEILQLK